MSEPNEIRFVGDMQRLELKPGDALVIKTNHFVSDAARARIEQRMEEVFPGVRVIIADAGVEIGVIGREGGAT